MRYSVSDFLNTYGHRVRLVAGQGGLARAIGEVGILDYELVPGLKSRYQRTNFYEGQLVLSTFLYARDNPFLITDAVRYLVSVGAAGLVVKNVFHLELPEVALRYANARNLPVLVVADEELFFDHIILDVGLRVRELSDSTFAQRTLDTLLQARTDARTVREQALRLNPSFDEEHVALYALVDDVVAPDWESSRARLLANEAPLGVRSLLCPFDDGLLLVVSGDVVRGQDVDEALELLRSELPKRGAACPVGVGAVHQSLDEMGHAVLEAIHAARLALQRKQDAVRYGELGILRAILPHATSGTMCAFAQSVLDPLRDFDAENNARLLNTLQAYLECGRSLSATAERLGTHPNTIRYRLGQVVGVNGLDWRVPEQMEQLSLAYHIEIAREISWD